MWSKELSCKQNDCNMHHKEHTETTKWCWFKGVTREILSLHPFFVIYTCHRKELALCLCFLCLNVRIMYNALYSKAKKDSNDISDSKTDFLWTLVNTLKMLMVIVVGTV